MPRENTPNRRLLLVDDTSAIHEDYRKILADNSESPELEALTIAVFGAATPNVGRDFDLTSAMQGQEALRLVEQHHAAGTSFAAAFVDMRMPPGWDGLETIEKIWQVDPKIQMVICTAYSDYSWKEIISRIGWEGKLLILKKPFDAIEVRQLASTLCRKWELERAAESENQELKELSEQLSSLNSGLEKTVFERTASLQLILDSTGEGIFTVDLEGRILLERSKVVESWLGELNGNTRIWDYLAGGNSDDSDLFRLAFEQMADDLLPFEVARTQAPSRIKRADRTIDLIYREIRDGAKLERILVVLRDVTTKVEAEQARKSIVELQTVLGNVFEDSAAFGRSIDELEQLIARIQVCRDMVETQRLIHTLKGNAAVLGFRCFASEVHDLESLLEASATMPSLKQIEELNVSWNKELKKLGPFIDFFDRDLIHIRKSELDFLIDQIKRNTVHQELLCVAESWMLQPLRKPLKRLATQAERIANQLHKKVDVQIDDGGLSMPEERLAEFWPTMIHVIRNAIDHGLESPAERRNIGKPEDGKLLLQAEPKQGWIELRVCDDGQGINWEKIRRQAKNRGLPTETKQDLVDALFSDGFSLKGVTTEISGRGVGLSAVRQATQRLGGGISVASTLNEGTTFTIRFPFEPSMLVDGGVPSQSRGGVKS